MSSRNRKFALTTAMALVVVVVMLFGGASATAYASQSALPGDTLYSVKTTLEQTRVALARDTYFRTQLHLQYAQRRMDEIVELIQQGRFNDVELASSEFEYYIQNVIDSLDTVLAGDPARGADLSNEVTQILFLYTQKLQDILANTPEPVRHAVERVILVSEHGVGEEMEFIGVVMSISDTSLKLDSVETLISITEFTEMKDLISQGDTVKIHVFVAADGKLIADEIELFDDFKDEIGDANDNGNDNGDDNLGNDNSDDDGENDNSDDDWNENDDDDDWNENDDDEDWNENDDDDDWNENDDDDNDDNGDGDKNGNDNDEEDD